MERSFLQRLLLPLEPFGAAQSTNGRFGAARGRRFLRSCQPRREQLEIRVAETAHPFNPARVEAPSIDREHCLRTRCSRDSAGRSARNPADFLTCDLRGCAVRNTVATELFTTGCDTKFVAVSY
jgi:hypothetical protein